jgi:hypothetical protein
MNVETIVDWFVFLLSGRAIFVAGLFYVGCATLDLNWAKTLTICVLVYFLHVYSFGSRRLEQAGLLVLAIGVASWIDLVPAHAIVALVKSLASSLPAVAATGQN